MKLSNIKTGLIKTVHMAGLKVDKYSPEILLGLGITAIVGGVILACHETLKVEEILNEHEDRHSQIDKAEEMELDNYSEEDASKDRAILTIKTGVKLLTNYAPSIALIGGGIVCILSSYGIMKKRNVALMAAYEAVSTAFDEYRKRVKDELGEDMDRHFRYGGEPTEIIEYDENGNPKKVKATRIDGINPSQYAKFFDEANPNWTKSAERNMFFLRQVQNWANEKLISNGHLFLNEVYDMLNITRTSAGAVVGWVLGNGNDFVDFGLYNINNERARMFVNGDERSILLDFNVDGVIYDKI